LDGVVTFLIVAALVFGLFIALTIFARELFNYVRSRTKAGARKTAAAPPPLTRPRRLDDGHAGTAGSHGDSVLTHDALYAGHAAAAATHAAADTPGVSGAGESSSGSWGETPGGYDGSSSGGESGGGDYGGGGDFGGGGGGGGWS
jgi:hypothetical protein